ncbi:3'(2'),5'-bisphosphate nucleotidase CysQ family protein [Nannocystis radixulma]|uniref:3'(2'),5-bisphosphonucleoside 3'(2')-phosphohydrolase n=1 Tax=Nannocystis radixulma TaxID=2995305 RepID=A0ABT5BK07_9BACT|nr:3'(2'),5'-bisphosphate nucleotidase CysQ [Nannocystis radixulma]MDC0673874.1 3'(2'),5'-bisphosphate nucleotidase CysQ [Nannocystis radixulma]
MATFDHELRLVLSLAREAGATALAYQTGGADVMQAQDKPDDAGPVTRADTEINARLVAALKAAFPADAVVAEESPDDAAAAAGVPRCWYVDPIDGTAEYARGETCWAIQIGLCVAGEPVLGVVHEAGAGRLSWGICTPDRREAFVIDDDGAATPLRTSARSLAELRLVSSLSHASPKTLEVMQVLGIPPERNLRLGSVGVKVGTIARGEADLYVHPRSGTKLWDTCAPWALLRAVGGAVTDLWGHPLVYDPRRLGHDNGLVASHGPHHAEILAAIRPLVDTWYRSPHG